MQMKDRIHSCQKPIELYSWILDNYANQGDKIFDPMMGSQSSRIAAYKMGFDYVGCELDKEYFDKGCERFEKECHGEIIQSDGQKVTQLNLF
jgi:site-specific DNA-methyltransferase (adenine-specific)